ncbi:hypothetical protein C477_05591 [Haloterrigena salina JCM 13891]|uniref:Uncharacterized protein n=1 Tax=Haloterrigena salina JCM 13891 TaxID=1227488 RepID=M0CE43_9EURY|nr:hypothetical protein [Haloterrigena salina]ELZ21526.1 hypothetical protein C477_05591 [Haloterrigena salina JCM 13891]
MTDYEMHEPDFSGTTTEEWDEPQLEDFDISERSSDGQRDSDESRQTDDLSEVADHFILSSSGFPPENFTDLKLPVVDPDGNLNKNALQTAKSGGHGVGAVEDLDDDTQEEIEDMINELANDNFDDADFGD